MATVEEKSTWHNPPFSSEKYEMIDKSGDHEKEAKKNIADVDNNGKNGCLQGSCAQASFTSPKCSFISSSTLNSSTDTAEYGIREKPGCSLHYLLQEVSSKRKNTCKIPKNQSINKSKIENNKKVDVDSSHPQRAAHSSSPEKLIHVPAESPSNEAVDVLFQKEVSKPVLKSEFHSSNMPSDLIFKRLYCIKKFEGTKKFTVMHDTNGDSEDGYHMPTENVLHGYVRCLETQDDIRESDVAFHSLKFNDEISSAAGPRIQCNKGTAAFIEPDESVTFENPIKVHQVPPASHELSKDIFVQLIDENGSYSTAKYEPSDADDPVIKINLKEDQDCGNIDIQEVVIEDKPFRCKACEKTFKRAWELFSHEVVHNEERPYQCDLCDATFKRHSDYKSHKLVHTDDRPFKCEICGKPFKRSSNLQEHRRSHTGERPYHCACCDKNFRTPYELQRHMLIHCTEKPFKCSDCGKDFPTSTSLVLHQRQHCDDKPHVCGICGKKFTYGHSLKVHVRVHTGDRPFVCRICGKGFKQSNALASHERVHTGERPFDCKTCGKAFKQSSYLVIHERSHTGERPYKCEICEKAFARPSLLLQHHRVHSEERPYKCHFCEKCFKDLSYLTVHEKAHRKGYPL
ncbi:zinc finger protein 70-like [Protopterus annectens]|uniref:zinc finger protein 70-like n=1 Tax=Protopterus annectens TaxID=7888 RepID=UPI001CFB8239|nr:zinc finger protein 70-like [Protopterus annectens]XP_043934372.1 zinc finger protein 70-like [Protopterus annectens]